MKTHLPMVAKSRKLAAVGGFRNSTVNAVSTRLLYCLVSDWPFITIGISIVRQDSRKTPIEILLVSLNTEAGREKEWI